MKNRKNLKTWYSRNYRLDTPQCNNKMRKVTRNNTTKLDILKSFS